jgi:hypothetical protein
MLRLHGCEERRCAMTAPNSFPGIERVSDHHQPAPDRLSVLTPVSTESFRTVRVKVHGTDRVLQLGTMATAHVPGSRPFTTDTKNAAEFPSYALAVICMNELSRRLNAAGGATWTLDVVEAVHESTESWSALHRFDRTALEAAYFLAESLPVWIR